MVAADILWIVMTCVVAYILLGVIMTRAFEFTPYDHSGLYILSVLFWPIFTVGYLSLIPILLVWVDIRDWIKRKE